MRCFVASLICVAWLVPAVFAEDRPPAKGRLLVANAAVEGELFGQTVILLVHYDENGAMGIVVNRPTDVLPEEVVDTADGFAGYSGRLYWGGPVQMGSLRALMRAETPPKDAETIVDWVHQVRIDDELMQGPADPVSLRFYIGYAGWSAGQLDRELARGSWYVLPASDEEVFAEDPLTLWQHLVPPRPRLVAARPAPAAAQ